MTMTTASLNGRAHTGGVTDDDRAALGARRQRRRPLGNPRLVTWTRLPVSGSRPSVALQYHEPFSARYTRV